VLQLYCYLVKTDSIDTQRFPSFTEWIEDATVWACLAKKCELSGLFVSAADMYAQALFRDSKSFKEHRLWFNYAKACARCGKIADAQLAAQVCV
jgi:hypothetical protein